MDPFILHVVGNSCEKSWPGGNQIQAWKTFCHVIHNLQQTTSLSTRAFVLMSNHYHWICSYDLNQNESFFEEFQESVRSEFLSHLQFGNSVFERAPEVFPIENIGSFRNTIKYIYRNPVSANLVYRAEDYPYSTLCYLIGKKRPSFQCKDDLKTIYDPIRILDWINCPSSRKLYFEYGARIRVDF